MLFPFLTEFRKCAFSSCPCPSNQFPLPFYVARFVREFAIVCKSRLEVSYDSSVKRLSPAFQPRLCVSVSWWSCVPSELSGFAESVVRLSIPDFSPTLQLSRQICMSHRLFDSASHYRLRRVLRKLTPKSENRA